MSTTDAEQVVEELFEALEQDDPPTLDQVMSWIERYPDVARGRDTTEEDFEEDPEYCTALLHMLLEQYAPTVSLEVIESVVDSWPAVLEWKNDDGDLPLHLACENQAPLALIQFLTERSPQALTVKGWSSKTPLHLVVQETLGLDVLEYFCRHHAATSYIIERFGNTEEQNNLFVEAFSWQTPIEYLQVMVQYRPQLMLNLNNKGIESVERTTVLHCACRYEASQYQVDLIQWLLQVRPDHAGQADFYGVTPLQMFLRELCFQAGDEDYDSCRKILRLLIDASPESIRMLDNSGRLPLDYLQEHTAPLQYLPYLVENDQTGQALHFYFQNGGGNANNSHKTVAWIIQAKPEILAIPDSDGNLPYHLALRAKSTRPQVLYQLAEAYPQANLIRNQQYQYPLHLAAQYFYDPRLVESMLAVFPAAIEKRDSQGWLPFQLAAQNQSCPSWSKSAYARKLEDPALEMTYYLLRFRPELLIC
jgi:ankyrin repeat protein